MVLLGRKEITTTELEINESNIIKVLQDAMVTHTQNVAEIEYLLNYDKGVQPLKRKKTYRPDVNVEVCDNIANEVTEFKLGFVWGSPLTLVHRGIEEDSTNKDAEAIATLNECYDALGIKRKTQELARYIEVTGVGYTYVDVNSNYEEEGDSYFTVDVLNPSYAFVVKSSRYVDKRPMLGVSFCKDDKGNTYYSCFTKDSRYEIVNLNTIKNGGKKDEWKHGKRSGEKNPLGAIPIIEYIRSHDRMGCFERVISECDNLNILISDFTNDVDQNCQAIWHGNDISFPIDEEGNIEKPKANDWVLTYTPDGGKQPFIQALAVDYEYSGMLNNIITRRSLILQKCNVPQRNDNSGGSTGIAMSDATGWSSAEASACKEQAIIDSCKMQEVKVVLKAIKCSKDVDQGSSLLKLRYSNVQPSVKRQRTYELTTKANFIVTLLKAGFYGEHVIKTANAFDDANQVWIDSKEGIERFQESQCKSESTSEDVNADRLSADNSDQITNSPMIDGMTTKELKDGVDDEQN